jgi:hypothetical protein
MSIDLGTKNCFTGLLDTTQRTQDSLALGLFTANPELVVRLYHWKMKANRPLGRPSRRWEDNIRMHLGGIGWVGVDWKRV